MIVYNALILGGNYRLLSSVINGTLVLQIKPDGADHYRPVYQNGAVLSFHNARTANEVIRALLPQVSNDLSRPSTASKHH